MASRHAATLVLDYDDTVVGFKRFGTPGEWLKGALEAMNELLADGYALTIATCRVNWHAEGGAAAVMAKLDAAGLPARYLDEDMELAAGEVGLWVGRGKPLGQLYVDDRGAQFDDDWDAMLEEIHERVPRPRQLL